MRINGLVVQKSSKEEKLVLPSYASIELWLENLSFSLVLHTSSMERFGENFDLKADRNALISKM